MSRYRSSGGLDDAVAEDGDRAFLGIQGRLEPDQLNPGQVSISENGRMDRGVWQPRCGIKAASDSLEITGNPVTLPFTIEDDPLDPDAVFLDDNAVSVILGSCLFSDPAQESAESVVIAANGKAFAVDVATGTSTDIAYPTGSTLSGEVDLMQAFDRVTLFRNGAQAWEWYGTQGRAVTSAVLASNVVTVTLKDHGLTAGDTVVLSGIGYATTNPNGSRVVASIGTADTFTFALTGANETFTAGTGTAVTGFTKVRAGAFTQPQVFEVTAANANVVSGLATFTVSGNTTITAGDTIRIYDATDHHFTEFIGKQFSVIAATSTTVQFYIPVADHTGSGHTSEHISIGKEVSIGAGFMNMPAPPWGVYHQRRMWVPFWYSQTGTTASPTFTDRKIRDEIAVSDILDNLTYDQIANQFRITAGIADFTVAMQPFYEDAIVVFNRNSLHLVSGVSGGLSDTTVNELTREIGCLARKSIAQRGPEILFLSDNGVYSVSFLDQYNLRGVDLPLSDAIQPTIDRINRQLAANAVGAYFDNRYFLAVPLDSTEGAGDATGNNAILVYNFLNKAWESVDSVNDSRWNILNFHIARSGDRNDIYAVNDLGGLHKIDATDDDVDELSIVPGENALLIPISSRLVTRRYTMGDLGRKRFSELQIQVESGNSMASDGALSVSTEDPDEESATTVISSSIGELLASSESASIRSRVGGLRGHGASVEFSPTAGRPKLRSVRISATSSNRATVDQK